MTKLWKLIGVVTFGVMLAFTAVAAYDALAAHGVSRLQADVRDLKDSVRVRDVRAALADEQALRQFDYIVRLNAELDTARDSLRRISAKADSTREAARPARRQARVVRGVDVDTLFLAAVPYVVPRPVTAHVALLEGVIAADSNEISRLRPYVARVDTLRDSLASLDATRRQQLAERDGSIATRDGVIAKQDSLIRKQNPKCGRKCGVAIGASGTAFLTWLGVQLVRAVGGA